MNLRQRTAVVSATVALAAATLGLQATSASAKGVTPGPAGKFASPAAATSIPYNNCTAAGPTAADNALAVQLSPQVQTDRMSGMDGGQVSCARVITQVAQSDGLSQRAAVIAVTTAMAECQVPVLMEACNCR